VISPTDLTVFKALFNRTKDWADIEAMLQAGSVDSADALRWVAEIVGEDHPSYQHLAQTVERAGADRRGGGDREGGDREGGDPAVWKG
ncbi:MAG TPA: hypothetical protein VFN68_11615, partial [Acidimicrobiales bacterium]|nr:hypothetical protein [Acidimicrobiales bacterium]